MNRAAIAKRTDHTELTSEAVQLIALIMLRHSDFSLMDHKAATTFLITYGMCLYFMPYYMTSRQLTRHGVDSDASRVSQPALKPRRRLPEAFVEEVAHDGRELLPDVFHPAA